MDRLNELIEKYFEATASPAECAELTERLQDDPAAAEVFARRSRLEAGLRVHFQEEQRLATAATVMRQIEREIEGARRPRRSRIAGWRWGIVAACLLVVTGATWWFWPGTQPRPEVVQSSPGAIKVVSGSVQIDGRDAKAARQGDLMQVVSDIPAILSMVDGSQAEMDPASLVIMQDDIPGVRQVVQLLEGAGTFKVQPGDGEFQVETEVGRVIVVGTEFRVKLLTRADEKERSFPGTRFTGMAVVVISGIVQVDVAGKSHILTAGQDRLFRPEREAGKGMRETLAIFESANDGSITVRQGGDRPKSLTFPLATDARITIDGKPADVTQLARGANVYLQRFPGEEEVFGVRGEGASVVGVLASIDAVNRKLTMSLPRGKEAPPREKSYTWSPDVQVVVHGESRQVTDLTPGVQLILKLSVDGRRVVEIVALRRAEKERRP